MACILRHSCHLLNTLQITSLSTTICTTAWQGHFCMIVRRTNILHVQRNDAHLIVPTSKTKGTRNTQCRFRRSYVHIRGSLRTFCRGRTLFRKLLNGALFVVERMFRITAMLFMRQVPHSQFLRITLAQRLEQALWIVSQVQNGNGVSIGLCVIETLPLVCR